MKKKIAVLLALLMLLSGCSAGNGTKGEEAEVFSPQEITVSENNLLRREDVDSLLVAAVEYDEEGYSVVSSVTVLSRDAQGSIGMLTLPRDTRVWVEHYDENGEYGYTAYGTLGSVYHQAESAGLGEDKLMEAVRSIVGIRVDHILLLNTVQLKSLAQLTDGVYLTVSDPITMYGIPSGYQDITHRIESYASYSYLKDDTGVEISGTDVYKLERHQNLIEALLRALAEETYEMSDEDALALSQQAVESVRTDMDAEQMLKWIHPQEMEIQQDGVLDGWNYETQRFYYWIADNTDAKEWTIAHFYKSEDEEET